MLIVTPSDLVQFTHCPRRASRGLYQGSPQERANTTLTPHAQILKKVIQSTYLFYLRKGHAPSYKWIRQWTERYMLESLPDIVPGSLEHYKAGKGCLASTSKWYSKVYTLAKSQEGYINVPVTFVLASGFVYLDTIPIITNGEHVELQDFYSPERASNYPSMALYNDMAVHIRSWGFRQATGIEVANYTRILIDNKNINPVTISILPHMMKGAEKNVNYITTGLKKGINYPVFGEQCNGCPDKHYCMI